MSTAQLLVGPHSSSSLIRTNSNFETGKITLNGVDGIAINISSIASNSLISSGGIQIDSANVTNAITVGNIYLVSDDNTIKIGLPSYSANETYPLLGTTMYTTDFGMGLTSSMVIPDALQQVEGWINTFLIDTPPAPVIGTTSSDEDQIIISWTNPTRYETGFQDIKIPFISEILIDYVLTSLNGDDSFSHPSTVTINTGSDTVDELILLVDGTTSGLVGDTWQEDSNLLSQTAYDIQIRPVNYNSTKPVKTLIVKSITTQIIGPPGPPTGVTAIVSNYSEIGVTWTEPLDHNTLYPGNNDLPYIELYGVTFTATGSVRYGGLIADTGVSFTDITIGSDSLTNLILEDLNPGTTYNLQVYAKNSKTDSISTASSTVASYTTYPNQPEKMGTGTTLSFPTAIFSPFTAGGYNLSGTTAYNYIVNYNNIDGTLDSQVYKTNNSSSLLSSTKVADQGTGTTVVSYVTGYAGINGGSFDSVNASINGFGPFILSGLIGGTSFSLGVTENVDTYNGLTTYEGFWRQAQYNFQLSSSFFIPSDDVYELYLQQKFLNPSVTTVQSASLIFAVDDLNISPSLSELGITSIKNQDSNMISYFSGVPMYNSTTDFTYRVNMAEIASNYLRNDKKHLDIIIKDSDGNVISNIETVSLDDIGVTHKYYNKPISVYTTSSVLHNTSGLVLAATSVGDPREDIQFNDFDIGLNITSGVYTENIAICVTGYNLYGSDYIESGYVDSTGTTKALRIDLNSYNADLSSSDFTGNYGQHVNSGVSQYPNIRDTDFGITYDHTQSIISGSYTEELQLVNGLFCGVSHPDSFLNYTSANYFFPPELSIPVFDYSNASSSGYRYTTFKYKRSFSNKINKVKITLINATGFTTNFSQEDGGNHHLFLRVADPRTLNPGDYTFETAWLNCNNPVNLMGVSNVVNGSGCLLPQNSTTSVRYCLVKPCLSDALFYVKVGILNSSTSMSIEKILFEIV